MKTTAFTAMFALGLVLFAAPATLAQTHSSDRAVHQQRRLADHQRHDAGISWQQDRQIHRQGRQADRLQHRMNNQYGVGYGANYGGQGYNYSGQGYNLGATGYQQVPYSAYQQQYPYSNSGVYQQSQFPSSNSGIYNNGYGQTGSNGHSYSPDGHRFDHHGNHDDGRFDR